MKEIWKNILGYEGLYQVSNFGRVKSLKKLVSNQYKTYIKSEIILKVFKNKDGYIRVNLYKNGKTKIYLVHRLVAEAFIPNTDNLPQVNHKDEQKDNNIVSNLEWCTSQNNANYGTRNQRMSLKKINGKSSKPVLQYDLNGNLIKEYKSTMDCQRNGFNSCNISLCCNGKQNSHKGFIWKYK